MNRPARSVSEASFSLDLGTGGGSGFVGGALTRLLRSKGHEVEHVSRRPGAGVTWTQLVTSGHPACDAVINVAGANVLNPLRRWNAGMKWEVTSSRVESTRTLRNAIVTAQRPPCVWVLLTGVGYYRPSLTQEYHEGSAGGDFDFMSRLVRDWEAAARLPDETGHRVRHVVVRSGVVLGKDGGTLKQMLWPFRLGLGGPIGSGRQPFPWIHVDDLTGILLHALEVDWVCGVLNGVSPGRCTNGEFVGALADVLGRPSALPMPGALVRVLLGAERSVMLLEGQWVVPERTLESGYHFRFPELRAALRDLVS